MKKRERILMIITIIAVALGGLYYAGLGDWFDSLSSRQEELALAQEDYVRSIETLNRSAKIYREFENFGKGLLMGGDSTLRPELRFTQEINTICRSLGINEPRLDPAQREEIKGVDDYEFLTSKVTVEADLDKVVQFLKAFEARRLLFLEVDIRSTRDSPVLRSTVTVARIAPVSAEEIKTRQQTRRRAESRRPGGFGEF